VSCVACRGSRLHDVARAVRVGGGAKNRGQTLHEVCSLPLGDALRFFKRAKFDSRRRKIAGELLREVTSRL